MEMIQCMKGNDDLIWLVTKRMVDEKNNRKNCQLQLHSMNKWRNIPKEKKEKASSSIFYKMPKTNLSKWAFGEGCVSMVIFLFLFFFPFSLYSMIICIVSSLHCVAQFINGSRFQNWEMQRLWQAVVLFFCCFVSAFHTFPISWAIFMASDEAPDSPLLENPTA